MYTTIPATILLSLATLGLSAPASTDSTNGNVINSLNAGCTSDSAISIYIGTSVEGRAGHGICKAKNSSQKGGSDEVTDYNDGDCHGKKATVNVGNSRVGPYSIQQTGQSCESDGHDCFPVLTHNNKSYNMWIDDGCDRGGRATANPERGYWWRCKIVCPT